MLRTGGVFILRDHDVTTPQMHAFVSLAHAVFNAGLGVPWETHAKGCAISRQWRRGSGSTGSGCGTPARLLQARDPTDNVPCLREVTEVPLLFFFCVCAHAQVRRPPRSGRLHLPGWFLVHSPAEYAEYVRDHTLTQFPFIGHTCQFWQGYGRDARDA
jgi:hypothetical protein